MTGDTAVKVTSTSLKKLGTNTGYITKTVIKLPYLNKFGFPQFYIQYDIVKNP